jgi:hypothetical protein
MAFFHVHTKLPPCLLDSLRKSGAEFREKNKCKIPVVVLEIGGGSEQLFLDFLQKDDDQIDPLIHVHFGTPMAPYVGPVVQQEVLGIINSYENLTQLDFSPGVQLAWIPFIPPANQPMGPFQYHHAKIALHKVQMEIENPVSFGANTPALNQVPSGSVICDFEINYNNCAVVRRIRKM